MSLFNLFNKGLGKSSFFSNLVSPITSVLGNAFNVGASIINNERNLDYARSMTQAQFERDDTAYQRAVADAQSAGLSPLAVTGGTQTTNAVNYEGQAPQVDVNSMVQATLQNQTLDLERERLMEDKRQFNLTHNLRKEQTKQEREIADANLQAVIEHNNNIDSATKKQLQQQAEQIAILQQEADEHAQAGSYQRMRDTQERYLDYLESVYGTRNYTVYNTPYEYSYAMEKWRNEFSSFVSSISNDSDSRSSSGQGSIKVGFSETGASLSGGGSDSSASTQSTRVQAQIKEWYSKHPVPVFAGDKQKWEKANK